MRKRKKNEKRFKFKIKNSQIKVKKRNLLFHFRFVFCVYASQFLYEFSIDFIHAIAIKKIKSKLF